LLRASGVVLALAAACFGQGAPDRAAWMKEARWGVMTHYLADWRARVDGEPAGVEHWNDLIDGFNVQALAEQLEAVGAGYYLVTIGQNSGFYLAPNAAYDRLVGTTPSKCSRRDLVADLYEPLHRRGIKLMVYLPSGAPAGDAAARKALQWENGPHRNREFQTRWEEVIRAWSERWGSKVAGWWFDGCYWPNAMYRAEAPNFESFAAAARAGNSGASLAFNPGVLYRTLSITRCEDYIAGEVDKPELWNPRRNFDGKIDGARIHMLSFLGDRWGMGAPRFTSEQVVGFSLKVTEAGGAVTWDAPVERDGTLARPFRDQLAAVGRALQSRGVAQDAR
jgi:hypothetical protein